MRRQDTKPGVTHVRRNTAICGEAADDRFTLAFNEKGIPLSVSSSIVTHGDPNTFKGISGAYDSAPWAKDKNNFYCLGNIVAYADPLTAKEINQSKNISIEINRVSKTIDSHCTILQ